MKSCENCKHNDGNHCKIIAVNQDGQIFKNKDRQNYKGLNVKFVPKNWHCSEHEYENHAHYNAYKFKTELEYSENRL